ncbi:MAG: Coenzyme F420 hydrogenase/dehydrogenase, beta subunit C-terminal domain [Lachnospiraceae bacterium]|nr:Coenzyme F420 hydrogenase/dehydrogenase, beta subunit C-terminal domain [Lachnospiraceae bacterium]
MIELNDNKTNCCGCSACAQVCSAKCIVMETDEEGFSYPVIDKELCTGCGLCEKVCPILNHKVQETNTEYPIAVGGWHKDDTIRDGSSSGGAFSLFALNILNNGGVVYGCELDKDLKSRHIRIDNAAELQRLRGSKYVQSSLENIYSQVRKDVSSGLKVLFAGTPCQAAGLHFFLRDSRPENLYIVDFICHGVPSGNVFRSYIESIETNCGSKIKHYEFRPKDRGWWDMGQLGTLAETESGVRIRKTPVYNDPYMNGFLGDYYLRPSCYECIFKGYDRPYSDFTIADFWGVRRLYPELYDKKGTSLVLINNDHACDFWNTVKKDFFYEKVDPKLALKSNPSFFSSPKRTGRRDRFYKYYNEKGYDFVKKKYLSKWTWAFDQCFKIIKKIEQFVKFSIVGVSNVVINLAVYYLCIYLGMHYILAYTLGFLVSVCNAFFWNNRYVFVNKQEKSLLRAFCKVLMSYGFSFLLSLIMMGVLVDVLKIPQVIAPLLKMIVTVPINFVLNKVWAFKDR